MSENQKEDNIKSAKGKETRQNERPPRDTSPSTYSQSSVSGVLEWDPSADVGTRYTRPSNPNALSASGNNSSDLSILERIAATLTSDYVHRSSHDDKSRGSRTSFLVRSHSEDEPTDRDREFRAQSQRSSSLIDLTSVPSKTDVIAPTPVEIFKSQQKGEASSSGSLTTVVGQSWTRKTEPTAKSLKTQGLDKSIRGLSLTSSAGATSYQIRAPPNSLATLASQYTHNETDDYNDQETSDENPLPNVNESRKSTRGASDDSTDWEYGPSRSQSHEHDVSSLLEWQNSGLTKSEISYQNRKKETVDDSASTGTFSINVSYSHDQIEQPNQGAWRGQFRSEGIGVQFDPEDDTRRRASFTIATQTDERRKHSGIATQTDRRRQASAIATQTKSQEEPFSAATQTEGGGRRSQIHSTTSNPPPRVLTESKYPSRVDRSTQANQSSFFSSPSSEMSLPQQRFVLRRNRKTQVPSLPSVKVPNRPDSAPSTAVSTFRSEDDEDTHSNMSSTCDLLLNIAKHSSQKGMEGSDILTALHAHRLTHIKRFKRELRRLNKLNRLIDKASPPMSSLPPSSSTEEGFSQDENRRPLKKSSKELAEPKSHHSRHPARFQFGPTSGKIHENSNQNRKSRDFSSRPITASDCTQTSLPDIRNSSSTPLHVIKSGELQRKELRPRQDSIPTSTFSSSNHDQESFNFLMDKMNILTDICILNQRVPPQSDSNISSDDDAGEVRRTIPTPRSNNATKSNGIARDNGQSSSRKPSGGSKRAVSFFIPFPGCETTETLTNENLQPIGSGTTLREVYERMHPRTVTSMQRREEVLSQMRKEREKRAEIKREWIRTHPPEQLSGLSRVLPPKGERVMSAREMKELTRNKYKRLAEVKEKILQRACLEEKKTNRLMSQHFAHNLKKKVLRGGKKH